MHPACTGCRLFVGNADGHDELCCRRNRVARPLYPSAATLASCGTALCVECQPDGVFPPWPAKPLDVAGRGKPLFSRHGKHYGQADRLSERSVNYLAAAFFADDHLGDGQTNRWNRAALTRGWNIWWKKVVLCSGRSHWVL